jgi:formamidopyrimidine-DNA glycosylase
MPELPEVETIKRGLNKVLKGKEISKVDILWNKTVQPDSVLKFKKIVEGRKVLNLERRAKIIILYLDNDINLAIHLKMTGQLIFVPKKGDLIFGGHPTNSVQTPGPHTRLFFSFKDDTHLYFNDLRKFGWIKILDEKLKNKIETELGIEPLSKTFAVAKLENIFKKYPNRTVKQILLDQKLIAGIGNIYADETCFLAGVLPWRKAEKLDKRKIKKIHEQIISVLNKSLKYGGTSARDYVRSDGVPGGFAPHLMVYGRKGEPCKNCKTIILKTKHASRGTHYCPKCQK